MKERLLTQDRLKQLLEYDPLTGVFTRKVTRGKYTAGSRAGCKRVSGYIWIGVDREQYGAHRLAWLYMTGDWPSQDVDHRDRKRDNNRWENLRSATESENQHNSSVRRDNSSGVKGVFWHRKAKKWQAQIKANGRHYYLGLHTTLEAARAAHAKAANDLHGEFAAVS